MTDEAITLCTTCKSRPLATATRCRECADAARAAKDARVKAQIEALDAQGAYRRQLAREGWRIAVEMGA